MTQSNKENYSYFLLFLIYILKNMDIKKFTCYNNYATLLIKMELLYILVCVLHYEGTLMLKAYSLTNFVM